MQTAACDSAKDQSEDWEAMYERHALEAYRERMGRNQSAAERWSMYERAAQRHTLTPVTRKR